MIKKGFFFLLSTFLLLYGQANQPFELSVFSSPATIGQTLTIEFFDRNKTQQFTLFLDDSVVALRDSISQPVLARLILQDSSLWVFLEPKRQMEFSICETNFEESQLLGSYTNDLRVLSEMRFYKLIDSLSRHDSLTRTEQRLIRFENDQYFISTYGSSFYSLFLLDRHFLDLEPSFLENALHQLPPNITMTPLGVSFQKRVLQYQPLKTGNTFETAFPVHFRKFSERQNELAAIFKENKFVLIDFWASWCYPCQKNIPALKALQNEFGKHGFSIVGVSIDKDTDRWAKAVKDGELLSWSHFLAELPPANDTAFIVESIPLYILINREGKILRRFSGTQLGLDNLRRELLFQFAKE